MGQAASRPDASRCDPARKGAYYNEHDPFAAAWLRELISAGLIAPGEVDERSIEDVRPDELAGFVQCHFFAGIGVWSYALRRAGVPDDYPLWTGSCPCQPFSAAGKGEGFADERHLWPAFFHLVEQCRPGIVLGEQVASKDGYAWLDLVQTDLEALDYAFGPIVLPAAGFGAPHGRHRTFFVGVGDSNCRGWPEGFISATTARHGCSAVADGGPGVLAHANDARPQGRFGVPERAAERATGARGVAGELADADVPGEHERAPSGQQSLCDERDECAGAVEHAASEQARVSGLARQRRATSGYWGNADWIPCRGGKWRPIEPGTFPLAHGAPARMGRLRGYGNAINAEVATAFIEEAVLAIADTHAQRGDAPEIAAPSLMSGGGAKQSPDMGAA